jgi:2-iminobutanoate/2-iminopropanoate deaminase
VSGCIGMHKSTGALDEGGVSGQTRQVMENMKSIVEAAGSSMDKVLKVFAYYFNVSHLTPYLSL